MSIPAAVPLLTCEHLTKRFGSHTILDDVSLVVTAGESVALLGPNGAGKSTFVDLLLGLLGPDSGRLTWHDAPGDRTRVRAMLQEAGYIDHLTGQELLQYETRRAGQQASGLDDVIEALHLTAAMRRPVRLLSGGEKRKLDLVLALAVPAELLILDEPTTGMDLEGRQTTIEMVRQWCRERGQALLLTTHLLEEADALADRVLILADHRLQYDRPTHEIGDRHRSVFVDTTAPCIRDRARSLGSVISEDHSGIHLRVIARDLGPVIELLAECRREGLDLPGLRINPVSLTETYQEVVDHVHAD